MKPRKLFAIVLLVLASVTVLVYSGTTGKITGQISDATTGEPLISANVVIRGTTMGAATDFEGNYVILNVPPGVYTLSISSVGYQPVQYSNVQVNIDLTTTIDVKLQPTVINIGEQIITAERSLVIKDMTSSLATMTADQIRTLPVQAVQQVLRLNAGIIEDGGRLSIRGGRTGEVAYWVDGISATDLYDGRVGVAVENSAVQELQVISGTFNAEYGQAMSGIVNIITKEGGEKYTGQIKLYAGDYVSNRAEYNLYKKLVTEEDRSRPLQSGTGYLTKIVSSEVDKPLADFNPIYNGEFSLSGPLPLIGSSITFFANGRYFYDEGYYYGRNWFRPTGVRGDSSRVALNPNENMTLLGKLTFQATGTMKLGYNVYWNSNKRERNYFRTNSVDYQFNVTGSANFNQFNVHDYKYNPYGIPQFRGEGLTHTVTLNHVLSPSTFYELRASRYTSKSKQFVFENPTQKVRYLVRVEPNPSANPPVAEEIFDPTTTAGKQRLQEIISDTRGITWSYIVDPNGPDGYTDPQTTSAQATASFVTNGMDRTRTERSSAYWVGKFDMTSQINKTHQLKFGSEVRLHELELHSYQLEARRENNVIVRPYEPAIPEVGSIYRHDYYREPREASLYIQDKIEFNDIILNVGLRYDYFDANANIPTDPTDPNIYGRGPDAGPFKEINKYKDLNGNGIIDDSERVITNEYTPSERRKFMQKKVDPKTALSPRLGISFPITDRGVIHFSYGHFFQIPEFQYLYANPDFKVSSGSGTSLFGNPDLKPQKTVQYEIGLQQQLTDMIGVDVTLFYRDIRDWVGTSRRIQTAKDDVSYSQFVNKDYENVRGVTLKLEKRYSNNFSFRADYTFQVAEGTYSNPTDEWNAVLAQRAPVLQLLPVNWDQRHTVNAQFVYNLFDWSFSVIGRYWAGRPYTPAFSQDDPLFVAGVSISRFQTNSERRSDQKSIDLTVNKSFKLFSDFTLEVFVNVYNVLDQKDATAVYADTGSPDYTTNNTQNPNKVPYDPNRVTTVEDFVLQPSWYTAPRQIQAGITLGF